MRTVLIAVNILILMLPIGGIAILRLYESELIRQTESELIAQAAVVVASYRQELLSVLNDPDKNPSLDGDSTHYGNPVSPRWTRRVTPEFPFEFVAPKLDAARDLVRPPADDAVLPVHPPDSVAEKAAIRLGQIIGTTGRMTLAGIRITDFRGTV
ncbi:MAG: histidine kinase, partial [Deltaproteobacteria bacterium]|nr:histidine kinase [Deltaproteobacteria bacterium]